VGLKGLLTRGMAACMNREAKYCLGQFAIIGVVSSELNDWAAAARNEEGGWASQWLESADAQSAVASVVVGVACTLVSHPDDVVKTRQQTRIVAELSGAAATGADPYRSYWGSLRHVYRGEGLGALFKGSFWRCCVRVPLGLTVINWVHPRLRPAVQDALEG